MKSSSRWMLVRLLGLCAFVVIVTGCGETISNNQSVARENVGSCMLDLPDDAPDDATIQAVIQAEGTSVVSQDIDTLMALWADDALVSDAKYTPEDDSDDQRWDGKDAIRHRYVRTVFPGAPASAQPSDLVITINGDKATVVATTRIGDEVSPAGDRWQLSRQGDCWLIKSLTYNLEPTH